MDLITELSFGLVLSVNSGKSSGAAPAKTAMAPLVAKI
jgi:hypothetical protein